MDHYQHITALFEESISVKQLAMDKLQKPIADAATLLINTVRDNKKTLVCGNGGSAGDAQHFAAELLNRFEIERRPLAALALTTDTSTLTAIANDYSYSQIFAKQVAGLGQPGDCLFAISTSGNSDNIIEAIKVAHTNQMNVIAMTGKDGGEIGTMLNDNDIEIRVPSNSTARTQEVHILVVHCLCSLIDHTLFSPH